MLSTDFSSSFFLFGVYKSLFPTDVSFEYESNDFNLTIKNTLIKSWFSENSSFTEMMDFLLGTKILKTR
jgi:hypothetical protein